MVKLRWSTDYRAKAPGGGAGAGIESGRPDYLTSHMHLQTGRRESSAEGPRRLRRAEARPDLPGRPVRPPDPKARPDRPRRRDPTPGRLVEAGGRFVASLSSTGASDGPCG